MGSLSGCVGEITDDEETDVTVTDTAGRTVSLSLPLDRVVLARIGFEEILPILGVGDRVTAISEGYPRYLPHHTEIAGWEDAPSVGFAFDEGGINTEAILNQDPDAVLVSPDFVDELRETLPDSNHVIALDFDNPDLDETAENIELAGEIFDREQQAESFIENLRSYQDLIQAETKGLSREEKPTFYLETFDEYVTFGTENLDGKVAANAGGYNLVEDAESLPQVEFGEYELNPEWLLENDPEFIFRRVYANESLADEEKAQRRLNELIDRPGWENLTAVQEGNVYLFHERLAFSIATPLGRAHFAKCFQPELFTDLQPRELFNEYLEEWLGSSYPELLFYPRPGETLER
ncbi:periplasmic binding protein [Natrialba chahannaoensis JCM 10990]|uniref:Periplasmic binding protein n=2 Tax=Natrialba chahannaoensis TaxID=68911 RepID=M0ACK5_9EURY|nr:periplasmic binding protein [Natrialba chahannaoensis JCM 10990]